MTGLYLLLLLFTDITLTSGGRILFVCLDHYGHVGAMLNVGKTVKAKGHEVYAIVLTRYAPMVEDYGLNVLIQPDVGSWADDEELMGKSDEVILGGGLNPSSSPADRLAYVDSLSAFMMAQAIAVIENKKLFSKIEDLKFDLAVVDGIPINIGTYIIPYRLGIPYVTFTSVLLDPWMVRLPSLPSVEPTMMFADTGNQMSFAKRIQNFITMCLIKRGFFITYPKDDHIRKYAPNRPFKNIFDIYKDSEMFLVNQDVLFLEYPRVESTNVRIIGAVGGRPAKPLNYDLEKSISSSNGFILVSFGSVFEKAPNSIMEQLFTAFSRFSQLFIIRYTGNLNNLVTPKNVRVERWLPQNDLLGHPKILLFINHAGYFGQIEGFYHKVPMLMAPINNDQPYNALRAEEKGYGKIFDIISTSGDEMEALIHEMLNNSTYKENIKRASEIVDTFPRAEENAAFWIDHVFRFGSKHLKPSYLNMPLYQYFMLDILALFIILEIIFLFLCCCCLGKCWKKFNQAKEREKIE